MASEEKINILVLGSGGREHALAWKLKESSRCKHLFVAPGNPGTAKIATNLGVSLSDFEGIASICRQENIRLLIIGPEAPLVEGLVDFLKAKKDLKDLAIIGPSQHGARLEGSKDFSKQFMQRHGIPTAKARSFTPDEVEEGMRYLEQHSLPIVLKADGLAAGKGVILTSDVNEAKAVFWAMLKEDRFGKAGHRVLVEECLHGVEVSCFVLTDGEDYLMLPAAKDYKRIGEGDTGPNTGGMGAVSPVPFADRAFKDKVEEQVVKPTIAGLRKEKIEYFGFLFIGLMNVGGEPMVIEYNCRLGDPETQAIVPRLEGDFVNLLLSAARGKLAKQVIAINAQASATIVLAAEGYPDAPKLGDEIPDFKAEDGVLVFHAGTACRAGKLKTNGGRVMTVTALAPALEQAVEKATRAAEAIAWRGRYFRRDIGQDVLAASR